MATARFNLQFPDPHTEFVAPGDATWRDYFLRLNEYIKGLTAAAAGSATAFPAGLVAALPVAATVPWTRRFVTDGSTTLILGLGSVVVGGGSNKLPVFSDGSNWIIG